MMGVQARRNWSGHSMGLKKGTWTPEEDQKLKSYIEQHGHGTWRALPAKAGLQRGGKSCRLRWTNYLRPGIKRGKFSLQEEGTIIQLHALLGNRWSAIATHLPKRTDNEIKNYWNTHLKKRLIKTGIDPATHKPKTYATGSASPQFKDAANLSHMVQWESARLEAEARFVQEYNLRRQYKPELSATALSTTHSFPAPPKTLGALNTRSTSEYWSLFADPLFNSSDNALPAALPSGNIGQEVNDNSIGKGANDWNRCSERLNEVPEPIKHNATPLPTGKQSSRDEFIVIPCGNFIVEGFSLHRLPHNSSLFSGEDSSCAAGNCMAGSGGGGFEEDKPYWSNVARLHDSSIVYSFQDA